MPSAPRPTTSLMSLQICTGALALGTALAALFAWTQIRRSSSAPVASTERIYVADWANHRVVRMDDMTGAGWISIGERGLFYPVGVCLDRSGRLVIAEQRNDRVILIDPDRPRWTTFRPPESDSKRINKHMGSWVAV